MYFLLAGLIAVGSLCCLETEAVHSPSQFDFLALTREWPFSFCSVQSCKHKELLPNHFSIHGLWAQSKEDPSKPPMFCNSTAFNKSELEPIQDELKKSWMDLLNPSGSPLHFWHEEFIKHGSCVATDPRFNTTYLYFKAALELNKNYNLIEMLAKGGVTPGPTPVDASKIRGALRGAFGFKPMVRCSQANGQVYLYELRLCFTKDLSPMDCNDSLSQPARVVSLRETLGKWANLLRQQLVSRWTDRPTPALVQVPRTSNTTYECRDGEMVLLPESVKL